MIKHTRTSSAKSYTTTCMVYITKRISVLALVATTKGHVLLAMATFIRRRIVISHESPHLSFKSLDDANSSLFSKHICCRCLQVISVKKIPEQ